MKKLLTAILFFSVSFSYAQNWAPTGAKWHYNDPPLTGNPYTKYFMLESKGDTVLSGKNCKIIGDTLREEYMYDENGKVYYWQDNQFRLLYDFSANENDTLIFTYRAELLTTDTILNIKVVIDSISIVFVTPLSLNRYYTHTVPDTAYPGLIWPAVTYTERIGSEMELIEVLGFPGINTPIVLRCYTDSVISYITDWWVFQNKSCDYKIETTVIERKENDISIDVYPNPTEGKFRVASSEFGVETIQIFDLFGRLVLRSDEAEIDMSSYPAGLYVWQVGTTRGKLLKE